MSRPIVAYHSIFGAYGFWLPNDPRGSWSTEVKADHLKPFGEPIHPGTRKSVAGRPHDRTLRFEAKQHLLRKNVVFDSAQIDCIGRGLAELISQTKVVVYATAIMPDHVHLVYPRPECSAEQFVGMFKRAGSRALRKEGLHPFAAADQHRVDAAAKRCGDAAAKQDRVPTPWAEDAWHVFLHDDEEIRQRIEYVNNNPIRAGRSAQHWEFVTDFGSTA